MNSLELKMLDILRDLKENYRVVGVKAEFEAEGTRLEEALRLKEIVTKAGLGLTIKIGGCEALKDLYDARVIGADKIVAPMIESAFALKKFYQAAQLAFPEDERKNMKLMINIETITAFKNLDEILGSQEMKGLDGIVLGRGDMAESLNLTRHDVNKQELFDITKETLVKAKEKNLLCGIGGGVTADTLPFLEKLPKASCDFFETRKVLFQYPENFNQKTSEGILKAMEFELLWLKNKKKYYLDIAVEDDGRIKTLEERYQKSLK